jgi:hypothetical protein
VTSAETTSGRAFGWLDTLDATDLALRLTLLTLLLRPVGAPTVRVGLQALAALGLAVPACLRHPGVWAALTALAALRVLVDWSLADNHAYLLAYWCFAITLSLAARDPRACLALNARLLVGWAFAFAVLWKLALSPDYLDGRFFRVAFLTDARFADFARLAGGLDRDRYEALQAFVHGEPAAGGAAVALPARLVVAARVATLWTLAIEAAVALAWLSPLRRLDRRTARCRAVIRHRLRRDGPTAPRALRRRQPPARPRPRAARSAATPGNRG